MILVMMHLFSQLLIVMLRILILDIPLVDVIFGCLPKIGLSSSLEMILNVCWSFGCGKDEMSIELVLSLIHCLINLPVMIWWFHRFIKWNRCLNNIQVCKIIFWLLESNAEWPAQPEQLQQFLQAAQVKQIGIDDFVGNRPRTEI